MGRILFGLILFVLIVGAGVIWTVRPGTDVAYEAAKARILAAIEEDRRILRLDDLNALGRLPPELGEVTGLIQLDLSDTVISDISVLAELGGLRILNLRGTLVEDLTPLEGLAQLDTLDIGQTWVRDFSPLVAPPNLRRLDVGDTWSASLEPIARMPALDWINLHGAYATDGSEGYLRALESRNVTVNNARAFQANYAPGFLYQQKTRLKRLIRRVQLGLGALE